MSLKEIFCQDKAVSILQRAFTQGRMSHAYIFSGPEGVGRCKTAREWAKLLICEHPILQKDYADSCGSCNCCRVFEAGSHPDYVEVYKELVEFTKEPKGRKRPVAFPVDVVREFLIEKVQHRPILAKRRVFVLKEAEKLNIASQNALLKVLEEPPSYCSIILLCTRFEKLLATVKSRCQVVRFGRIDEERTVEKLIGQGIEGDVALYFARFCQGRLGQACQLCALELADAEIYNTKKKVVSFISTGELSQVLDMANWLLAEAKKISSIWSKRQEDVSVSDINRKVVKLFVNVVISALRDAVCLQLGDNSTITNFDQKADVEQLAKRFDPEAAAQKITNCYNTLHWIDSAVNEKLIFEQLLLNPFVCDTIDV
ncbi:MAG: hypothetical protein JXB29_09110 [Sedimentisphaerales bacterium]|nr:hypothetical protein [Sedimentisphaerales bacterium]